MGSAGVRWDWIQGPDSLTLTFFVKDRGADDVAVRLLEGGNDTPLAGKLGGGVAVSIRLPAGEPYEWRTDRLFARLAPAQQPAVTVRPMRIDIRLAKEHPAQWADLEAAPPPAEDAIEGPVRLGLPAAEADPAEAPAAPPGEPLIRKGFLLQQQQPRPRRPSAAAGAPPAGGPPAPDPGSAADAAAPEPAAPQRSPPSAASWAALRAEGEEASAATSALRAAMRDVWRRCVDAAGTEPGGWLHITEAGVMPDGDPSGAREAARELAGREGGAQGLVLCGSAPQLHHALNGAWAATQGSARPVAVLRPGQPAAAAAGIASRVLGRDAADGAPLLHVTGPPPEYSGGGCIDEVCTEVFYLGAPALAEGCAAQLPARPELGRALGLLGAALLPGQLGARGTLRLYPPSGGPLRFARLTPLRLHDEDAPALQLGCVQLFADDAEPIPLAAATCPGGVHIAAEDPKWAAKPSQRRWVDFAGLRAALLLDLGGPHEIAAYRVQAGTSAVARSAGGRTAKPSPPAAWRLEGSADGCEWRELHSVDGAGAPSGDWEWSPTFTILAPEEVSGAFSIVSVACDGPDALTVAWTPPEARPGVARVLECFGGRWEGGRRPPRRGPWQCERRRVRKVRWRQREGDGGAAGACAGAAVRLGREFTAAPAAQPARLRVVEAADGEPDPPRATPWLLLVLPRELLLALGAVAAVVLAFLVSIVR